MRTLRLPLEFLGQAHDDYFSSSSTSSSSTTQSRETAYASLGFLDQFVWLTTKKIVGPNPLAQTILENWPELPPSNAGVIAVLYRDVCEWNFFDNKSDAESFLKELKLADGEFIRWFTSRNMEKLLTQIKPFIQGVSAPASAIPVIREKSHRLTDLSEPAQTGTSASWSPSSNSATLLLGDHPAALFAPPPPVSRSVPGTPLRLTPEPQGGQLTLPRPSDSSAIRLHEEAPDALSRWSCCVIQ